MNEQGASGDAPLSVSAFLSQINTLLETQVAWVEGEVSNFRASQGRFAYFDVKDDDSVLSCFMMLFRLRVPLEDGMKVRLWGVPKVYPRYGKFSLTVERVELSGEGALRRAFELLKRTLGDEGLFAPERKRTLPRVPERIGLITSPDAAAYTDFLKVLRSRRGGIEILFVPATVQGRDAPGELLSAIELLNDREPTLDALVLVRGGGGLEELQAFNDEHVVRAIARSRIPTIVGVGHERDVTLADLVADVRASTPSNAAELLTPTREALDQSLRDLVRRMDGAVRERIQNDQDLIRHAVRVLQESVSETVQRVMALTHQMATAGRLFSVRIERQRESVEHSADRLRRQTRGSLETADTRMKTLERLLESLHPERVLSRGYSVTRGANGRVLRDVRDAKRGEVVRTLLAHGTLESAIHALWPPKTPPISPKPTKSSRRSSPPSKQATLI